MKYVVLGDLETGSKEKNAVVFSFAAALFDIDDPSSVDAIASDFVAERVSSGYIYEKLHIGDQWLEGRITDADTHKWWMQKRLDEARKAIMGGTGSLKETVERFFAMVKELQVKHQEVYGKDSKIVVYFRDRQFDDNIIQDAAERYGIRPPYYFNQRRDVRTYIDAKLDTTIGYIPDFKPFPNLPRHHAMVDVLRDAASMCEAKRRSLQNTRLTADLAE